MLVGLTVFVLAVLALSALPPRPVEAEARATLLGRQEAWDYAPAMRAVAERFRGTPGVVLHLGDSITYDRSYTAWARGGEGQTEADEAVLRWSHCGENNDRDGWYLAQVTLPEARSYTAANGIRSDQYLEGGYLGLPPLEAILEQYRPQVATILLGTNDAWQHREVSWYAGQMATILQQVLAHDTVPILSTLPPFIFDQPRVEAYNDALWKLAEQDQLPVIDFYGEVLARRPGTSWDGTLLEQGDAHPTAAREGVTATSAPTPANLRESGYLLRGWLSVQKLAEVKARVFDHQ